MTPLVFKGLCGPMKKPFPGSENLFGRLHPMFVHPRKRGAVVSTCAVLALSSAACDAPTAITDLRPDGEPEVLSVLVMNDGVDFFIETATFCAVDDDKRPGFIGLIGA